MTRAELSLNAAAVQTGSNLFKRSKQIQADPSFGLLPTLRACGGVT
jgi:hypothetical protein